MHTRIVTLAARLTVALTLLLSLPTPAMGAITLTGPSTVSEGAGTATYNVSCGGGLTDLSPGLVSASGGSATAGDDFSNPSPLTAQCVPAIPSEHTIEVPIVNDTIDELDESFTLNVTTLPSVTTTIVDDDPVASITPLVFVTEGDSGTQMANMVVTLASAAVQTTTIAYETSELTASAGSDYDDMSGNVVFQPGDLTQTISIPVFDDTLAEDPEAFFVNLLTTDNGSLDSTKKQTAVGIFDNDQAPLPTVSVPKSVSLDEGNRGTGNMLFDVKLSSAATQRTVVGWKTLSWTADKRDYGSDNGKVVFKAGQKSKTISVDVKGDRRNEPDEAFAVELQNPAGATLSENKASFGIIEDDDGPKMRIGKPRLRGERMVAKLGCPRSAGRCKGKLTAKSAGLKLGRKRFKLDGGESKKLRLNLSDAAQQALSGNDRVTLKAAAKDASGDRRVTWRKARL